MKKSTPYLLVPMCALASIATAANNDQNAQGSQMPSAQAIHQAMDITSAKDPDKTREAMANCYTELATVLGGIKDTQQANEHASHVGMLVKQIMVLDKQWDAMKDMISDDAEDAIDNTYESKIDDNKDKAEDEAERLQKANFYGSVELRRAMTGFDD